MVSKSLFSRLLCILSACYAIPGADGMLRLNELEADPVIDLTTGADSSSLFDEGPKPLQSQLVHYPVSSVVNNISSQHGFRTNWKAKRDLIDISKSIAGLRKKLYHMKLYHSSPGSKSEFSGKNVKKLSRRTKILTQARDQILNLINKPDFDHFAELASRINSGTVESLHPTINLEVGDSIVKDLKRVINIKGVFGNLFDSRMTYAGMNDIFITLQRTGLNIIDSLLDNKLVSEESVKKLFQDPEMAENILIYTNERFKDDIKQDIMTNGSPYVTEHWYLPHLHESFAVLGEDERKLINTSLLLRRLEHRLKNASSYYRTSSEWTSLMRSFDIDTFWVKFGVLKKSKFSKWFPAIMPTNDPDEFHDPFRKITHILLMPGKPYHLSVTQDPGKDALDFVLVEILDHIEKYASKGIIEKIATELYPSADLPVRLNLVRLALNMQDLTLQAETYYYCKWMEELQSPFVQSIRFYEYKFDSYIRALEQTILEFKKTFQTLRLRDGFDRISFTKSLTLLEYEEQSATWLLHLKRKISLPNDHLRITQS